MILDCLKSREDFKAEHEALYKKYEDIRSKFWRELEEMLKADDLLDKSYGPNKKEDSL